MMRGILQPRPVSNPPLISGPLLPTGIRPRPVLRCRASSPSSTSPYTKQEELCVIVNENNEVVGAQPRSITVRNRLLGRGAYSLVFHPAGHLLISRRSLAKDVYPGLLDVVTAGVVRAGESYRENAQRELTEELGLDGATVDLADLGTFRYEDAICSVWGCLFVARLSAEQAARIILEQGGEVMWTRWVQYSEVRALLQGGESAAECEATSSRRVQEPDGDGAAEPESDAASLGRLLQGGQFTPVGRHVLGLFEARCGARDRNQY